MKKKIYYFIFALSICYSIIVYTPFDIVIPSETETVSFPTPYGNEPDIHISK